MATLIASAHLEINAFIGNLYVADDYVALDYVEGGVVSQDLDLATTLSIASSNVSVTAVGFMPGTSSMAINAGITTNGLIIANGQITSNISSTLTATALDLDLATSLSVAGATISVDFIRIRPFTATLPITSTIDMGLNVFDIEVDPFNTFIVAPETRLNTIGFETRVNQIKQETRLNTLDSETRVNKIKQETRVFEPA